MGCGTSSAAADSSRVYRMSTNELVCTEQLSILKYVKTPIVVWGEKGELLFINNEGVTAWGFPTEHVYIGDKIGTIMSITKPDNEGYEDLCADSFRVMCYPYEKGEMSMGASCKVTSMRSDKGIMYIAVVLLDCQCIPIIPLLPMNVLKEPSRSSLISSSSSQSIASSVSSFRTNAVTKDAIVITINHELIVESISANGVSLLGVAMGKPLLRILSLEGIDDPKAVIGLLEQTTKQLWKSVDLSDPTLTHFFEGSASRTPGTLLKYLLKLRKIQPTGTLPEDLRCYLNSLQNNSCIVASTSGVVLFANSAAALLFGMEIDDLKGILVSYLLPALFDESISDYRLTSSCKTVAICIQEKTMIPVSVVTDEFNLLGEVVINLSFHKSNKESSSINSISDEALFEKYTKTRRSRKQTHK